MSISTDAPLILAGALPGSDWLPASLRMRAAVQPAWVKQVRRVRLIEATIGPAGAVPEPGHLRFLAQRHGLERPAEWPAFDLLQRLKPGPSELRLDALTDPDSASPLMGSASPLIWRLQPVHFLLGRDHIRLTDPHNLELTLAEAQTLLQAIEPVFESEGLRLGLQTPAAWWLTARSPQDELSLETFSLQGAIGRNIEVRLPHGVHRRRWQRVLNECQMLWHAHPVNAQRESRGQLPVNGLWIEGPARWHEAHGESPIQAAVRIDTRLLEAQSSGDPMAWLEAWEQVCRDYFPHAPQDRPDDSLASGSDPPAHGVAPARWPTILTGDCGWRVLGPRPRGLHLRGSLQRLFGRAPREALDWLEP